MSAWTPDELRKLAGAPATEIWIGTVRAALRHAADLTDAAHDVRDENERLREWNRQMVEKAASGGTLDGYRELGAKLANAEAEIERLRADLDSYMTAANEYMREADALRKDAERWKVVRSSVDAAEELYASVLSGRDPDADIAALAQTGANDAG